MNKVLCNDLNALFPCRWEASVKRQNGGSSLIKMMDSRLRGNDGDI